MAALTLDSLTDFVSSRGFGWYQIRDRRPDGPLLDSSHIGDDPGLGDDDTTKIDVPQRLETALKRFGPGNYMVLLKSKPNSKSTVQVQQMVTVTAADTGEAATQFAGLPSAQQMGLGGFGYIPVAEAEERTRRAVTEELDRYRREDQHRREMDELRRELREVRNAGFPPALLEQLSNVLQVVAVAVVAKTAPEALPIIQGLFQADATPSTDANDLLPD